MIFVTHQELALTAAKGRLLGLDMVYRAASGHPGRSLSAMDLLTDLYQNIMRIGPQTPPDPGPGRFVRCPATSPWLTSSCSAPSTGRCPATPR